MSTHEKYTLVAEDGRELAAYRYLPDGEPLASVALLPAFAVKQRFYRHYATYLADQGFAVLTFDTRGIGESLLGHVRDSPVTTTEWVTLDHVAALRWLQEQPGPNLAVGHSLGGQIPGVVDAARCLDGLYGVAAQLGYWGHFDGAARWRMRATFSVLMPGFTKLFGYLPGWTGLGEDVPGPAMLEWAAWLRSPNYLVDHVPGAAERYRSWPGEYVGVGFTDDTYAPVRGVRALTACYDPERAQLTLHRPCDLGLDEVGHFGFFRPEQGKVLWEPSVRQLRRWAGA